MARLPIDYVKNSVVNCMPRVVLEVRAYLDRQIYFCSHITLLHPGSAINPVASISVAEK